MRRFFVLCAIMSLSLPLTTGCDMNKKKTEIKDEQTVTTPEGTTTTTESQKVEKTDDTK
jgi:hypothetical protein